MRRALVLGLVVVFVVGVAGVASADPVVNGHNCQGDRNSDWGLIETPPQVWNEDGPGLSYFAKQALELGEPPASGQLWNDHVPNYGQRWANCGGNNNINGNY